MDYQDFMTDLAKEAGSIIRKNFSLGMKKEWKDTLNPVTATDKEIEGLVVAAITKSFPDHGFLGEEGNRTEEREFMWICDPVDGTVPFSHGIPTCVFMLALTHNGRPIASVIYDPFLERMFFAQKNKGAFLNGKKISVSSVSELKNAAFAASFYMTANYLLDKVYLELMETCGVDISMGSIGYLDMLIACGEAGVVVFAGSHPWDSAAPDILVTEAGGKFTDLYGEVIDYRKEVCGHIASNGILHDKVLKIVKDTIYVRKD